MCCDWSLVARTPLYPVYGDKARFIDFYGWEMPVWFSSIEKEHMAVRRSAGVFDISHMKRTYIRGRHAADYLDYLCGARPSALKIGQLAYTHILNERGGIIDDGIVFRIAEDEFLFVTNACTAKRVPEWLSAVANRGGFDVEFEDRGVGEAMIALQGPVSLHVLRDVIALDMSSTRKFECVGFNQLLVSRSGYTGEDGVEIVGPSQSVAEIFEDLLKKGVMPCGLGSRDTLRLEMGYPLACVDFNEETNPYELNAQRFLDFTKRFIGKDVLENTKPTRIVRGVITDERVVLRGGYIVEYSATAQTKLTSGTLSPVLGKGIGLAFFPLDVEVGSRVSVDVRGVKHQATVVKPPFIK
ncbi:MAG: glycine cleavage system aminomethyltransferase GcvT [Thermoprotei archaeon]